MLGLKGPEKVKELVPHSEDPSIKVPLRLKDVPREKLCTLIWNSAVQGTARRTPECKKPYKNKKEKKALKRELITSRKRGLL